MSIMVKCHGADTRPAYAHANTQWQNTGVAGNCLQAWFSTPPETQMRATKMEEFGEKMKLAMNSGLGSTMHSCYWHTSSLYTTK